MEEEENPPPRTEEASPPPPLEGAIAPEISRRVGSILDAVENEAARLREQTREEAARYLEDARRYADGLVAERQRRIAAVSDELLGKSEAVVARLNDAAPVRQGFENLVRALGDAAERLARETNGSAAAFEPPPYGSGGERPPHQPQQQPQGSSPAEPLPEPAYAQPAQQPPPYRPPAQKPPAYQPPAQQPPAYQGLPAYRPPESYAAQTTYPAREPVGESWSEQRRPQAPAIQGWTPPAPPPPTPQAPGPPAREETSWRDLDDARMVAIQMAAGGGTRGAVREHLHRSLGVSEATGILDEVFGVGTGEDDRVPWTAGPR